MAPFLFKHNAKILCPIFLRCNEWGWGQGATLQCKIKPNKSPFINQLSSSPIPSRIASYTEALIFDDTQEARTNETEENELYQLCGGG